MCREGSLRTPCFLFSAASNVREMTVKSRAEGEGLPPQRQFVKYEHRKKAVPKDQVTAHKVVFMKRTVFSCFQAKGLVNFI